MVVNTKELLGGNTSPEAANTAATSVVVIQTIFEQKATTNIPFLSIFQDKLKSIKPFPINNQPNPIKHEAGIINIRKEGIIAIFNSPCGKYEAWAIDRKDIPQAFYRSPHYIAESDAVDFLAENGIPKPKEVIYQANILQDDKNNLYMFIDRKNMEDIIKNSVEFNWTKWLDFMERYNIVTMIGAIPEGETNDFVRKHIIDNKHLELELKINDIAAYLAKKYNFSDFQYYRFRVLAISATEAKIQGVNYEQIAQEVKKLDHETFETR